MLNVEGRVRPDGPARAHPGRTRRAAAVVVVATLATAVLAACGSGTSNKPASKSTSPTSSGATTTPANVVKTLGTGVDATSIRIGVALVDFSTIASATDLTRSNDEQTKAYNAYFDDINKNGGINGRKIVPYYKFYSPLGTAAGGIASVCTSLTQDDKVFAVIGTFVDFSGDAQTCVANQAKRVLITLYLTQAIMDRSPAGLIVTPSDLPERSAAILVQLLQAQHTLAGKTVAVMGDTTRSSVVKNTIVPALQKAGVHLGTTALLDIGTSGDFTAALTQLDSFMEKWKTEGVDTVFLSGDLAIDKPFVEALKKTFPKLLLLADNTDALSQAQQVQQAGVKPNPFEGILTAGGQTAQESDASKSWKYCADIYKAQTGQAAPDAERTIKLPNGKIDDANGAISDACEMVSMFQSIATKVGPYLNDQNWISTVNSYGNIATGGLGPYASIHAGKYSADDNWRLQEYDSSLGNTGLWKPITPLQDVSGS